MLRDAVKRLTDWVWDSRSYRTTGHPERHLDKTALSAHGSGVRSAPRPLAARLTAVFPTRRPTPHCLVTVQPCTQAAWRTSVTTLKPAQPGLRVLVRPLHAACHGATPHAMSVNPHRRHGMRPPSNHNHNGASLPFCNAALSLPASCRPQLYDHRARQC